ncbi:MAG: glycoside hydrolase family protein [Caulobacteraceae bacterium]|nr:glycoside hydrolase family protein [Caulobacteraceae bacterium]
MTTPLLLEDLKRDEGFRERAYQDAHGVWTIGYGHAHADPRAVWTPSEAESQLVVDVDLACERLDDALPWWRELDDVRQDALANMAFNLGVGLAPCPTRPAGSGLQGFARMLAALRSGDYPHASAQMLLSDWAKDPPEGVGARAGRLAAMIRTGVRHP